MDLTFSPEQEALRSRLRAWLAENVARSGLKGPRPRSVDLDSETIARYKRWQQRLYEAGYVALSWPKEYGGQALDPVSQAIVNEEMVCAQAPALIGAMGLEMLGPTLITWGSEAQKRRYLPKILTAEEIWCQGYSEPEAGSDLAALKTRAELKGDCFVVNGQKVWTSGAQHADMMFCLVRTDPAAPKHHGISYLLIDMRSPGIRVRPLVQMTGERGFNEVFFEDVQVPAENLVGRLNEGWQVANATLVHERNMLGAVTQSQQLFGRLLALARSMRRNAAPLSRDPVFRQRLAALEIRVEAMKHHMYRLLTDRQKGRHSGLPGMINKLVGTELNYDLATAALEALGDAALAARDEPEALDHGFWPYEWMFSLGMIIGGGTTHIQKNIIAERGLGMPRIR